MDGEMDGVSLHEGALPHRSCNLVANDSAGRGSWRGGGAERDIASDSHFPIVWRHRYLLLLAVVVARVNRSARPAQALAHGGSVVAANSHCSFVAAVAASTLDQGYLQLR